MTQASFVIGMHPVLRILIVFFCVAALAACDNDNNNSKSKAELTAPPSDCFWVAQVTPAIEEADNVVRPDLNISYAIAIYQLPENALYFTLENEFPYARLMSLTSFDGERRIVDYIIDKEISPEPGSTNPFVPGNARNDPSRIYRIAVAPEGEQQNSISEDPANLLLTKREPSILINRIYLPDNGGTVWGNVGLPRVTLHMSDGSILQGEEACHAMNLFEHYETTRTDQWTASEYAATRGAVDPSQDPPKFRATWGYKFLKQCDFGGNCDSLPVDNAPLQAGDASNLYSFLSREHGAVLAIRAKLPETPVTSNGEDFAVEGQLRYWSICSYEYYSERAKYCLYDEQVQVNDDGYYTIVISRDQDLPDNATRECGVSHLGWSENGDGFGVIEEGRENFSDDGFMYIRNVAPSTGFTQVAPLPDTIDEEGQMEDYLPKGRYFSKEEFEGLGCNPWLALPYDDM